MPSQPVRLYQGDQRQRDRVGERQTDRQTQRYGYSYGWFIHLGQCPSWQRDRAREYVSPPYRASVPDTPPNDRLQKGREKETQQTTVPLQWLRAANRHHQYRLLLRPGNMECRRLHTTSRCGSRRQVFWWALITDLNLIGDISLEEVVKNKLRKFREKKLDWKVSWNRYHSIGWKCACFKIVVVLT